MKRLLSIAVLLIVAVALAPAHAYERKHYQDVERIFHRFNEEVHQKTKKDPKARSEKSSQKLKKQQTARTDNTAKEATKQEKQTSAPALQMSGGENRLVIALPSPPYSSDHGYWAISDAMLLFHRYMHETNSDTAFVRSTTRTTDRILKQLSVRTVSDVRYKSKYGVLKKVAIVEDPKTSNQLHVYRLTNKSKKTYTPSLSRFRRPTIITPGSIPGQSSGHIAVFRTATDTKGDSNAGGSP